MPPTLSEIEVFSLAAVEHLGRNAYGVSIQEEIERRTGRSVSIGSLYKALHRLEERDLVSTQVGEPTATRGGRAKKYIRIEPAGREALQTSLKTLFRMIDGLDADWIRP